MSMNLSESDFLHRVHQLDERALAEVYDQLSPGIFRYAMRLLGNTDLAEDCVAETFSRLLRVLHKGKGPKDHLKAYLYRIAHNWITDQYRRQPPPPLELDEAMTVDSGKTVQDEVEHNLHQERIRAALYLLPETQRQVIVLRYLEGWSVKEVAASLKRSSGAVKAIQNRATTSLRKYLTAQEENE
ncbi:MAG: sigma-70 family RNA polymerase sigma factor [Anaerolineaceae bacterium]|jgi:RNA polymerase sigma-70 factor (ECF subfamily)|nr:sigma-70 family RNA polymerase sigma factor [Anaerolineaceae bacterium]